MAHQTSQEGALWPSAMIRLGPHWRKVKLAGIVNCWLQHIIIIVIVLLQVVRLSCMAQLISILAQLYLEMSQFGAS